MAITLDGTNGILSPDFEPSSSTTPTNGLFLPAANALGFATNSTERLRLDASGNLGVGTTSTSSSKVSIQNTAGNTTIGSSLSLLIGGKSNASVVGERQEIGFRSWNNYNSSSGSMAGMGIVTTSTAGNELVDLYFYTAQTGTSLTPVERARIDSSGNLLVGDTTAPVTTRTYFKGSATSNSTWSIYAANSAGTIQFGLRNDNYFYAPSIGGYPTTGTTVVVNGNYLGYLSSSLRFKKDIVNYDKGLTEILALRPVYYKSKNPNPDGQYDEQRYAGLIAEEIADLGFDEFVLKGPDGEINSIQYGNMVALCIKAIQELTARLEALEAK